MFQLVNVTIDTMEDVMKYFQKEPTEWHDWYDIFECFVVTENFLRENMDKIMFASLWEVICYKTKLSEDFIDEFADTINWSAIAQYQKITPQFVLKHMDKIRYFNLIMNQKINWNEFEGVIMMYKLEGLDRYDEEDY